MQHSLTGHSGIDFSQEQFNRIFPFYLLVNRDLSIAGKGKSLDKIFVQPLSGRLQDHFLLKRPELTLPGFEGLHQLVNQLVVIECLNTHQTLLRGQIEYLDASDQFLFIGSPWFYSVEEVTSQNLNLHDFAAHDPLFDLLHVLKAQEITNSELKELLSTINRQKKQLAKAEQKYRGIIANMHLGLIELDRQGNIQYVNNSFAEMSGYSQEELQGRSASNYVLTEHLRQLMEGELNLRGKGVMEAYEIRLMNKWGEERWWLVSAAPLMDESGDLTGSIGIQLDITSQKVLQLELVEAKDQAEASTRAKEKFLANMSHEIRTPLNAILGMAGQVSKTMLSKEQHLYVDTIHAAAENLLVIINDILDLSKIEAGKMAIEHIGFDLKAVLHRAIQVLQHKAEERGLSFALSSFDGSVAPILIGDPYRLNQVLLNLLTNAIKFTPKGSVTLECSVLDDQPGSQQVEIRVKDTGIGMEASFLEVLFDKFNQEDLSVTRQYGGTGLGMSICKELVELMGGSISVQSTKGVGTEVALLLTLAKGSALDVPHKSQATTGAPALEGKRLLLVDDNDFNRLVAVTMLRACKVQITEAVNGQQAIGLLQQQTFDLVLMDVQMPVLDGLEATRIIRQRIDPQLPIIALTANAFKSDNDNCMAAGMSDFLPKPFKEEELINTISYWIERSAGQTEAAAPLLFDLSEVEALALGHAEVVQSIVSVFVETTPPLLQQMRTCLQSGDLRGVGALAHQLKPGLHHLGIHSLSNAIQQLVFLEKDLSIEMPIDQLVDEVESVTTSAICQLKNFLDQPGH